MPIFLVIVNVKNSFGLQNKKIYKLLRFGLDTYSGKMKIYLRLLKILKNVWAVKLNLLKIQLKNTKES